MSVMSAWGMGFCAAMIPMSRCSCVEMAMAASSSVRGSMPGLWAGVSESPQAVRRGMRARRRRVRQTARRYEMEGKVV